MNRRKLLQALAALPVVTVMSSCKREDDSNRPRQGSAPHQLQVLLDGAFAVVVQHDKSDSILAFSPKDKTEPHQFYFNDPSHAQAVGQNYNFELRPDGLRENKHTEIAAGLSDFRATVKDWKQTENFVAIKLPAPQKITFAGHRERVIFSSQKTGWMPTNHILEYEVSDPDQVKVICNELGKVCTPSEDSPSGLTRFFFEVGPPRGTPRSHAVKFFNDLLSAAFPELVADYSLSDILDNRDEQTSKTARLMSTVLTEDTAQAHLQNASYTLDCKVGGILIETFSSPR